MQEFDMEVTDERLNHMKRTLAMLYADQIGMEIKSIRVVQAEGQNSKEPA